MRDFLTSWRRQFSFDLVQRSRLKKPLENGRIAFPTESGPKTISVATTTRSHTRVLGVSKVTEERFRRLVQAAVGFHGKDTHAGGTGCRDDVVVGITPKFGVIDIVSSTEAVKAYL